jgi:hypothetical protein
VEDIVDDTHQSFLRVALGNTTDRSALKTFGKQQLCRRNRGVRRGLGRDGSNGEQAAKHSHENTSDRIGDRVEVGVEAVAEAHL